MNTLVCYTNLYSQSYDFDEKIIWKTTIQIQHENGFYKEWKESSKYGTNPYRFAKLKAGAKIYSSATIIQRFLKKYRKDLRKRSATRALKKVKEIAEYTEKMIASHKKKLKIELLKMEVKCTVPNEKGETEITMKDHIPLLEEIQNIRTQFNI